VQKTLDLLMSLRAALAFSLSAFTLSFTALKIYAATAFCSVCSERVLIAPLDPGAASARGLIVLNKSSAITSGLSAPVSRRPRTV
jgi:hypothetical protein